MLMWSRRDLLKAIPLAALPPAMPKTGELPKVADAPQLFVEFNQVFGSSGAGKHLRVNAEVPQRRGSIRVELLDSRTNQPLAGFSRQDCNAIVSGGRGASVTWKGSDAIPATAGSAGRGGNAAV
jgi:hypothetical protein